MNPVPASSPGWSFTQCFLQIGSFGPIFVFVAIILAAWLLYLIFLPRPLSDYFACLVATFYPTCLGLLGASLSMVQVFYELGDNGTAYPGNPAGLAGAIGHTLLCLIVGTGLTCFFMPVGLLVLLLRKPN
jgi:hypothetical protein